MYWPYRRPRRLSERGGMLGRIAPLNSSPVRLLLPEIASMSLCRPPARKTQECRASTYGKLAVFAWRLRQPYGTVWRHARPPGPRTALPSLEKRTVSENTHLPATLWTSVFCRKRWLAKRRFGRTTQLIETSLSFSHGLALQSCFCCKFCLLYVKLTPVETIFRNFQKMCLMPTRFQEPFRRPTSSRLGLPTGALCV